MKASPVGARGGDDVEGQAEAFAILPGQAVDQVHVDRTEVVPAAGFDHRERFLDRLDAIDRFLHDRIEILLAQAGAVESHPGKRLDVMRPHAARIEFDRKTALRRRA